MLKTHKRNKKNKLFHRNKSNNPARVYIKSYINHVKNNIALLEDLAYPSKLTNTYTFSDSTPYKTKVYAIHY
jgi:hypothetical protein